MSLQHLIAEIESVIGRFKSTPVVGTVITDVEEAGTAAISYIKTNGLQDLYQIALAAVAAAVPGASWTALLATIGSQLAADGKQIEHGAIAILAAQAQADLIAAGKLLPPAS